MSGVFDRNAYNSWPFSATKQKNNNTVCFRTVKVREKEWQIEQLKEQVEKEEGDGKFEEKLLLCQVCVTVFFVLVTMNRSLKQWDALKNTVHCDLNCSDVRAHMLHISSIIGSN